MECKIYNNHHDMLVGHSKKQFSGECYPLYWCDGENHGKIDAQGNAFALVENFDGKLRLVTCPLYSKPKSHHEERQSIRQVEQTFSTFKGQSAESKAVARFFGTDNLTMILQGEPGRGKTHLARALECQERENRRVEFVTAADLVRIMQDAQSWQDRDVREDSEARLMAMKQASLLIIDDLGEERVTNSNFFRDQLKALLDGLTGKLLITTNLMFVKDGDAGSGSLNEHLGDKISSRISERCQVVTMKGRDHRKVAA